VKYGYITFCNLAEGMTLEKLPKEMDRVKSEAEKYGIKLLFWGHPYGVSEGFSAVYESEKGLDNFFKFSMEVERPYTACRTNMVVIP
jgi:hypothetical protein